MGSFHGDGRAAQGERRGEDARIPHALIDETQPSGGPGYVYSRERNLFHPPSMVGSRNLLSTCSL